MPELHHRRSVAAGLAYISIPILSWGISFVVIKTTMNEIPPLTLAFLRFFIATLLVGPIFLRLAPLPKIAKGDRLPLFLLGFSGVTCYFAFENTGLQSTSASHGALIIATIPLCTELFDIARQRQILRPMLIIASLTALLGIFLLVGDSTGGAASLTGDLLIFGAVFSWVAYNRFVLRLMTSYPQMFLTLAIMVIGAVTLLPGALYEWFTAPYPWPSLNAWLGVGFLTVFCSILGYHCWNQAIVHLGLSMTNNLLYLLPLLGVSSGIVFLDEPLTANVLWGSLLIIGGVAWGQYAGSRPAKA